ncbi:MAG: hypothetical protein KDB40_05495 [Acidimicrobiales bacterium]|nr:hypothetical protein [Acidimicrobiales bacterium]MCB9392215.1 hypothetical protein [Acidimicrobiaceae bacterium]
MDDQTAVGVDVDEPHTLPTAFVEGSREARLDSVIAQELHADTEFAAWLCERAGRDTKAGVDRVEVWLNRWQGDAEYPADAHGETDVYAIVHFSDGSHVPLFIEDKVTAPFQPRQAERYRWRADAVGGRTILIAPERYPVGDVVRQYFDGVVTVEEIADRLQSGGRYSAWNALVLRSLVAPTVGPVPGDEATMQFTDYCVRWFQARAPHVVPDRNSLRTTKEGWLYFKSPASMIYKVTGVNAHPQAMVDVYVERHGLELEAVRRALAVRPCEVTFGSRHERAVLAEDSKATPVLRMWVDKLSPAAGVPVGPEFDSLELGLHACATLADWLANSVTDPEDAVIVSVPPRDRWVDEWRRFAWTYDAYNRHGFERCAQIANETVGRFETDGVVPADLDALRTSLFFEQRRERYGWGSESMSPYIEALMSAIADVSGGSVPSDRRERDEI